MKQLNADFQREAENLHVHAATILDLVKTLTKKNAWVYMANKDVYYIPLIVGIMPNLENFDATVQRCDSSFDAAAIEPKMVFAGFSGDFLTPHEAKCCFGNNNVYCVNESFNVSYISVKGTNYDGVTVKAETEKYYACYNIRRNRLLMKYGDTSYGKDRGCNIPVYRFNGEDSGQIPLGQTVLYWLNFGLRPASIEPKSELGTAYDYLYARKDYLTASGDMILLDTKKLSDDIHSGKEIKWLSKESLKKNYKKSLLQCDQQAVALAPYDEKILTDPNRGHWDLWDKIVEEGSDELSIDMGESITARNPAADVSEGIVAIDFGTKSTVVVYETDDLQVLPLQAGSGIYSKGLQAKNYENPTVLQFIDLDSFLTAYAAKNGRPDTSCNDVTVSHNAFENLKNATSDQHGTFFDGLKQWCGINGQRLKLQDAKGKVWELPPFMELQEQDMDPLEIYAYYLGRYINHMLRGKIFLHYVISFPVTYEHRIRERMGNSIRKGLKKSFPTALLANDEIMKNFYVRETASEPAAYAVTALQEYHFEPEGKEQIYYAVFDFGGGTTDFDFGMFKESEDDRYDYVLTHFGENGDRTLGGENLLRLLSFEVFRANKDYLLHPEGNNDASAVGSHIPFAMAPDAVLFAGHESLIKNSREAQQNMRNLMEKLRPVWEEPESKEAKEIISSGQIQLTLYRENGEKKTDANLKLKIGSDTVDLQGILRNRIEQGIRRFFTSLAEAFDKSAGADNRIAALSDVKEIFVFLAGNSSKSPLVTELFREYIGDHKAESKSSESTLVNFIISNKGCIVVGNDNKADEPCAARKLLKFGDDQPMPKFIILPPLGTKEAEEIRKDRMGGVEDIREVMMRPTGKTGVAYGLLKCRDGGEIKVESITPDGERVPFQYYIGRRKKGKFRLVIDRNAKLRTWYKFIDAGGAFDILYTDRPEAAADDAPMTIAKQKHISIEHPDKTAFVYIRPVESRAIEYIIAHDETELASGGKDKSDPKRIELE